jgi:hypothetical protein
MTPGPPQTPPPGSRPQKPTPPAPPPSQGTPQPGRGAAAFLKNIRLDITITDSIGPGGPAKKTVGLVLMNGRNGQIRSTGTGPGVINVDAVPHEQPDGRIRLDMTLEYNPEAVAQESGPVGLLKESLSVLLDSGKPMLITQSADPRTDRRVTVEVTATVLR